MKKTTDSLLAQRWRTAAAPFPVGGIKCIPESTL